MKLTFRISKTIAALALFTVLLVGGCKLTKELTRAADLGIWDKQPQLDSIDPLERIDAARETAKKFGGTK